MRRPDPTLGRYDDLRESTGARARWEDDECRDPTASEIRARMDRTRSQMDQTIDELQYRLTPQVVMQHVLHSCQHAAGRGAKAALTKVKENPVPAAVIGAGLAMLFMGKREGGSMFSGFRSHRRDDTGYADLGWGQSAIRESEERGRTVGTRLSDAGQRVGDFAQETAGRVRETASQAGSRVREAVSGTAESLREASSSAADKLREATHVAREKAADVTQHLRSGARQSARWADDMIHEYPLAAGAACFALGLAGGFSIPRSRREDELVGPARDRMMHQAQQAGSSLLNRGESAARQAVQSAGETVREKVEAAGSKVTSSVSRAIGGERTSAEAGSRGSMQGDACDIDNGPND